MEDNLNFFLKMGDDVNFLTMEDDLNFVLENAILTNITAQHRQPDQHSNQTNIGTIEKIDINWL